MSQSPLAVVVLAAGKGTRMRSSLPKVLHKVAGRSMLECVLNAAAPLKPQKTIAIVGHEADKVEQAIGFFSPETHCVLQKEQLGTGHAVMQTKNALSQFIGDVIILSGDVPLVTPELIENLQKAHQQNEHSVSVLSTTVQNPTGLGRIVRDDEGNFQKIIEHKDANEAQHAITEINTGIYMVRAPLLFDLLDQVKSDNAQQEFYLTDIIGLAEKAGHKVGTYHASDGVALLGVNTKAQLALSENIFQQRCREKALENGATLLDPNTVYFSADTIIESDAEIGPNVTFGPGVQVGQDAIIEGNCRISQTRIVSGALVRAFSYIEGADLETASSTGPFARLRMGSTLKSGARVGHFCEMKNATLGVSSKMSHLSYLGDATVGAYTNIGAGTITCNYDGAAKHPTTIGDNCFIGSDSILVAPLSLGDGCYTAAGSVITRNVPAGALAIGRSKQEIKEGYADKLSRQRENAKRKSS